MVLLVLLGGWEIVARFKWIDPYLLSSPSAIANRLWSLAASGQLFTHVYVTAWETLLGFIMGQATGVTFDIKHIVGEGNIVLTERVDTFQMGDKSVVLDVMGTFELRDGKIAAWRDFFDMAQWTRQTT